MKYSQMGKVRPDSQCFGWRAKKNRAQENGGKKTTAKVPVVVVSI